MLSFDELEKPMKKILTNPPFSAGMQAITERMKAAAGLPTQMEKEGRAIMARSEAAKKAAKSKPIPGTLNDPDWRRDNDKLSDVEYRAHALASEGIGAEEGGTFKEAVGRVLPWYMGGPMFNPESWCPGYSKVDPLARQIVSYQRMAQTAAEEAVMEREGTPEGAELGWEAIEEEIREFGACYTLITGKHYDNGLPDGLSNHARLEAQRDHPRPDLLSTAKLYRKTGRCQLTDELEQEARGFCSAFNKRALAFMPEAERQTSPLRVKRKDKQAVR
ncbi:hypothetical protein [Sulfitobacter dubius]|uniref:hypothetical protein n=1 Tax=Sulfitobacter dubius TaxID=218673 RepID=UPI0022B06862|nr:hypothetical protein [Sulfitobacter dubius]MCZ4366655.1 hypothetical protein [Sulfitobacter dubius]